MNLKLNLIGGAAAASLILASGATAQVTGGHSGQTVEKTTQPELQKGALRFDEENLDLGVVHDGGKISVKFPFKNVSDIPIMIIKVKPSCGCTVADEYEDVVIQPGESSALDLVFSPTGKVGRSSVTVRVETDDPDRPNFNLMLTAEIEPIVQADPSIIQFGDLRKGETKEIVARISGEMEQFKVLFATASDSDLFDIEVIDHSREPMKSNNLKVGDVAEPSETEARLRDGTNVRVTFRGRDQIGAFTESMLGRTNDERRKLVPVNLLGRVVGDVHIVPDRIGLGLVRPGAAIEKTLHVSSRGGETFEILDAFSELDASGDFTVDITPLPTEDGSSAYEVKVHGTLDETNTQRGPVRGTLTIKTNVPGEETLSLKMYGSVRPSTATPRTPR